jgi:1,4-alpha-glucan branching enzyme
VTALFAALARLADSDRYADPVTEPESAEPVTEPESAEPQSAEPVPRTFRLPAAVGASGVALVGDFNGWSHDAHPMALEGDWFTATVELEPAQTYRYRYLLDGERWENDWAADEYVPNGYGSDDSVVRT